MSAGTTHRESGARQIGFALAVGLGNVRWFPFQVGQEGSAILSLLSIGFVLLVWVARIRRRTTILVGATTFLLGVPVALLSDVTQPTVVMLTGTLAGQTLLATGGFVFAVLVVWIVVDRTMAKFRLGLGSVNPLSWLWIWLVRVPLLAVLLVSLYLAIGDYWTFLTGDVADYLGL